MADTKIEWADRVWNPIVGCKKVSPGCSHCYAEVMAKRLKAMGQPQYQDVIDDKGRWTGHVTLVPEKLDEPLHWRKPSRVFVNSMSDLFHDDVPDDFILQVFVTMAMCPQHTFQILTKRPARMLENLSDDIFWSNVELCGRSRWFTEKRYDDKLGRPQCPQFPHKHGLEHRKAMPNVWLGVSIENQQAADERIPLLLQTPAAVRFVSAEPLLGPADLTMIRDWSGTLDATGANMCDALAGRTYWSDGEPECLCNRLDWVIAGSESGSHARPAEADWFRSLRDQCAAADVPFFLKQMTVNGKLIKMPELDGKVWSEFPKEA